MKVLVLFALVAAAAAWPSFGFQSDAGGVSDAQKQHDINFLLHKIYGDIRDDALKAKADSFDPEADLSHYSDDGEAVHRLIRDLKDDRLLQQKHWFSLFNSRQRHEALMLFDVLIHCKDWDTFVSNAAYFRQRMNEGEFVYALYVAVIHSSLAEHVVLPPLYEVTPHLFTNSEVIEAAYRAKQTQKPGKFKSSFTGTKKNPEQRVAYFGFYMFMTCIFKSPDYSQPNNTVSDSLITLHSLHLELQRTLDTITTSLFVRVHLFFSCISEGRSVDSYLQFRVQE